MPDFSNITYSVATWNIWYDALGAKRRADAILSILAAADPDVVALQEVTPDFLSQWLQHPWSRARCCSCADPSLLGSYSSILSFRNEAAFQVIDLPSTMNRQLVIGEYNGCQFGTAHLESRRENTSIRLQQIEAIHNAFDTERPAVWMGDFNFDATWTEQAALSSWLDSWGKLCQEPGFTVDTARNAMTLAHKGAPRAVRYDRVLSQRLHPVDIQLLGTDAVDDALWPSDHFGLWATLNR